MSGVLIIHDETIFRERLASFLRNRGHRVLTAGGGTDILGLLQQERPRLVVLDVAMSSGTGYLLIRQLKSDPVTRNLMVVVVTDCSKRDEVLRALQAGAREYLLRFNLSLPMIADRIEKLLAPAAATKSPSTAA